MTRPSLRSLLVLAAGGLLASCIGAGAAADQSATRQQLIGMPQAQLLSCAGVPERSRVEGGVEYMTYENAVLSADTTAGFGLSSGFGVGTGVGVGLGFGVPIGHEAVRSNYCEATFTLAGGRVADVTFNTAGGYNRFEQCRELVSGCLAQ